MTEEVVETTEASTVVPTEAPLEDPQRLHKNTSKKPQKELSREAYVCSVCGATVVPEEHDTSRGVRYKCPKCNKFMRPLKPEGAEEIGEDEDEVPLEVPKEVARRMLRGGKYTIEEIMSETDLSKHVIGGLKGTLAKKGELPSQREREEGKEEERGPLLPDGVAMTERVKEMLAEELSTVYGVPQKQRSGTVKAILDSITQEGRTYGSARILCPDRVHVSILLVV